MIDPAALTIMAPVQVAEAGWRYTRWGMSPAAVISASRGEVLSSAPLMDRPFGRRELEAHTRVEGGSFSVTFGFVRNALADIELEPADTALCVGLHASLEHARGAPVRVDNSQGATTSQWYDDESAAIVSLTETGEDDSRCIVSYRPAPAPR